jgi:hypothetical protein
MLTRPRTENSRHVTTVVTQRQVVHYAGQMLATAITFVPQALAAAPARERPPLREGAAPLATKRASGIPATHLDGTFLTRQIEYVAATDPVGIPTGRRPRSLWQVRLFVLVDGVVRDELQRQIGRCTDNFCCVKMVV